ncbi:proline-rich protein 29 isoform X1 [Monodelphis domestica]|uniref:proline-rich protein 29 isoform X1 n=1 Tax=Monodelphis domestica TaxID=13616 RepID=UPI0024E19CB2|nr:proline-rich protein 29 isoform X1 [Monodelphis domestica]
MAWRDGWSSAGPGAQIAQVQSPAPSITILQSLPLAWVPPHQPGNMKEDLQELMMLQNIQMHQLLMNRLAMSALDSKLLTSQVYQLSLEDDEEEEEEEEMLVFHHHYLPWSTPAPVPLLPCPVLDPRQSWLPEISEIRNPPQDSQIISSARRGIPPPPPPSATGTVGADVPPASGRALFQPIFNLLHLARLGRGRPGTKNG